MRRPPGPRVAPRLDTNVRGLQELAGRGLDDLPSVGAKAAQLAELMRIQSADPACAGPIPTPPIALAIPVVHSLDHAAASGATALLAQRRARPEFAADPRVRAQALAEVRAAILAYPVDGTLLASVESRARALFGDPALPAALQQQHRGPARLQRRRPVSVGQRGPGRPRPAAGGRPPPGVGQPVDAPGLRRARAGQHRPRARGDGRPHQRGLSGGGAGQRRGGQPGHAEPPARRHPLPQRPAGRGQRDQPGAGRDQ